MRIRAMNEKAGSERRPNQKKCKSLLTFPNSQPRKWFRTTEFDLMLKMAWQQWELGQEEFRRGVDAGFRWGFQARFRQGFPIRSSMRVLSRVPTRISFSIKNLGSEKKSEKGYNKSSEYGLCENPMRIQIRVQITILMRINEDSTLSFQKEVQR